MTKKTTLPGSYTVSESNCWVWNGYKQYGYGSVRGEAAHRYVWRQLRGPIPDGMVLCHKCDNRGCVNPDHLFVGTQSENIQDMHNKGRGRRPMPYGTKRRHGLRELLRDIRNQQVDA